jgi:cytochrome c oxidase cbb3-type subunit 3
MLAWQGQLTPVQMQQVASYIKSIHGTNPPNAKESQGDLYQDSVTAAGSDSVVAVVSSKAEEATN